MEWNDASNDDLVVLESARGTESQNVSKMSQKPFSNLASEMRRNSGSMLYESTNSPAPPRRVGLDKCWYFKPETNAEFLMQ